MESITFYGLLIGSILRGGMYVLMALGLSLVFGVTKIANFAIGGLVVGIGFHERIPIHSIVPAILVATILMVAVLLLTNQTSEKKLDSFFNFTGKDLPKEIFTS
jgi:branched-subunit amino acid ABC-type transport system permease component